MRQRTQRPACGARHLRTHRFVQLLAFGPLCTLLLAYTTMAERHKPVEERSSSSGMGGMGKGTNPPGAASSDAKGSTFEPEQRTAMPSQGQGMSHQEALASSKLTDHNVPPADNSLPYLADSKSVEGRMNQRAQGGAIYGAFSQKDRPDLNPSQQEKDSREPIQVCLSCPH